VAERTRSTPITRDEIESKLRELQGDLTEKGESARQYAMAAGAVVVVVVVAVAFGLGRRRGRKRKTVVEVRRL
jgi:hypothetical protein